MTNTLLQNCLSDNKYEKLNVNSNKVLDESGYSNQNYINEEDFELQGNNMGPKILNKGKSNKAIKKENQNKNFEL